MLGLKATLVGLDLLNNRPGLLAGVVTQWRQVAGFNHVVIFGQTHRHHRDRFDDRSQFRQILNATIQVRAIVNGRAENKLRMTGDVHTAQALDVVENIARSWTIHHLAA